MKVHVSLYRFALIVHHTDFEPCALGLKTDLYIQGLALYHPYIRNDVGRVTEKRPGLERPSATIRVASDMRNRGGISTQKPT
jgi:hypothetical protein